MMVSVLLRLKSSGMLDGYPNLAAYVARGEARPAYKRAFAAQLAVYNRQATHCLIEARFDALEEPLPQGRHRLPEDDQDADDGQVRTRSPPSAPRGQAGQPRVLGLRGRIDRARPLRIVGDFRGETR